MIALTDTSLMPFGRYRGERMSDVPAHYLLWLWEDGHWNTPGPMQDYIKESFSALVAECPDFIVEHQPK